jgi:hypothetical protein
MAYLSVCAMRLAVAHFSDPVCGDKMASAEKPFYLQAD